MKRALAFLVRKRKKEPPPPPPPSSSSWRASPLGGGGGGYEVRKKELSKLHRAAAEGNLGKLQQQLKKRDQNQQDEANRTPLHLACANGCTDIVNFLVGNKCRLNLCDNDNRSPLMKAVQCRQDRCAVYLLEHGADPNIVDVNGNTALHFAATHSNIYIAERLLEHNAQIDAHNKDGSTPLVLAIAENNQEMAEYLLKKGTSIYTRDHAGSLSKQLSQYSSRKNAEKFSPESKKSLSVLSSPNKVGDRGFTLGAPATNKEVVDYISSGESARDPGKTSDDSWLSSEEEVFSPKKPQELKLVQLRTISQKFKKMIDEKTSVMRAEQLASSQQNGSDCATGEINNKNEIEKNHLPKESFKAGPQNTLYANKGRRKDQNDSSANHEEEVEYKNEEEKEVEHTEESQGEIENKRGKCSEKSKKRGQLSEVFVDNGPEWEGNYAARNVSGSSKEIWRAQGEEMQKSGDVPVSFITGHYAHSEENKDFNKENNDLPNHSSQKENSNAYEEMDQIQSTERNRKGFLKHMACSSDAFELCSSVLNSHSNKQGNLYLGESLERVDDPWLETEPEKHRTRRQNCKNSDFVDNLKRDSQELKKTVCKQYLQKCENSEEENLKEAFQPNSKEVSTEEGDCGNRDEVETGEVLDKNLTCVSSSQNQETSDNDKREITALRMNEEEGEASSPWDSECTPESLRKPAIVHFPTSAQVRKCIRSISEGSHDGKSGFSQQKASKVNLKYGETHLFKENSESKKSDLMGLDEGDDIEDGSDWDSDSLSLMKKIPSIQPWSALIRGEDAPPRQSASQPSEMIPLSVQTSVASEGEQCNNTQGNKQANNEVNQENHPTAKIEISLPGNTKKSEAMIYSEESSEGCSQIDSTLWEERYGKMWVANGQREVKVRTHSQSRTKIGRAMDIPNDFDDITQSSDSDLPSSTYREAMMLLEQLALDRKDSASLRKIKNIIHGYEQLIENEKEHHTLLLEKVKKVENEKKDLQRILDDTRAVKFKLEHQNTEQEENISSLKVSFKQEEEKRISAEVRCEQNHEQLRRKEEQYSKEMMGKQDLELMLRNLEMELKMLKNRLQQAEEERDETQRQLSQEQNARSLQEGILNSHIKRQRDLEEEAKKAMAKSSKIDAEEKDLSHKNQILQDELAVLKLELDQLRVRHQEEEIKYLEENKALKEKVEELKKELKRNEEALTQTIFQCNEQINVSKTESAMLTSKLELMKENKGSLEAELDSFRSRLSSAVQDLEQCQISKTELAHTLHQEHDEWLRLKDQLNHELSNLRESNNCMSHQLNQAESKANGIENELHHVSYTLREKNSVVESIQRELCQAQYQIKELENARQAEKDQMNKHIMKRESMQERLAQLQSENLFLRQQVEDFQNQGIIKERAVSDVQVRFSDIFNQLKADAKKEVEMAEEKNKEITAKYDILKDQVSKYKKEKVEREIALRQLQQELVDSLKKQARPEASLEVTAYYRSELEEENQRLPKGKDLIKYKVQKQNMLSESAQGTQNMWEEELKSKSKPGIRLSELDKEKADLMIQLENEKKKVKKLIELKRSVETQLDQEMKRNSELQKDCIGFKRLLKTTKQKIKEYEHGENSSHASCHGEIKNRYSKTDAEVEKLRAKLEAESTRCTQLESTNRDLRESMRILCKNHETLEKSKLQLEEEVAALKQEGKKNITEHSQIEQYKRDIEEQARQEIKQKLGEVNLFLQRQAASQENLEQLRATNTASLKNRLEQRILDLEFELARLKLNQQDHFLQKEPTHSELERYKGLYSEELKMRKSLGKQLDQTNEKLAEANTKLLHERQKSTSLVANSLQQPGRNKSVSRRK